MNIDKILEELDAEISRLKAARAIIANEKEPASTPTQTKRSSLSAEGRARIVAALKARWAKKKNAAK